MKISGGERMYWPQVIQGCRDQTEVTNAHFLLSVVA